MFQPKGRFSNAVPVHPVPAKEDGFPPLASNRVLKKSARRNGFPFALAAAFSVEPFDADGVRA
jgi:hypothetical protein